jgi:hypothetical protein
MHHCVGDYWDECVDGDRIFALKLSDGERATAQFVPKYSGKDDVQYMLEELRGPANTESSPSMLAFAERLVAAINAEDKQTARRAVLTAERDQAQQHPIPPRSAPWLDTTSEQQLRQALIWIEQMPARPEVMLVANIAGYGYHAGPELEDSFATGQALALVREPDNPYDPLAVRIDWQGQKIGYVPRPENRTIAHALDDGFGLAARIVEKAGHYGDIWHRVTFAVETVPDCSRLAA